MIMRLRSGVEAEAGPRSRKAHRGAMGFPKYGLCERVDYTEVGPPRLEPRQTHQFDAIRIVFMSA
jgi:hypothetical protein